MQKEKICTNIVKAYHTAFINADRTSNIEFQPQLLLNDPKRKQKVLHTLSRELQKCDSFAISVAFITESGIAPLKGILDELERKGVKGRIITTDYLTFSQPKALEDLLRFKNIELRIFKTHKGIGFHTKSYIFKKGEHYSFIVGSSNLTDRALCLNHEWNTYFLSMETGAIAKSFLNEFDLIWNDPLCVDYLCVKSQYEEQYKRNYQKRSVWVESQFEDNLSEGLSLKPNKMQERFIENLKTLRENGAEKALLISATGTGKPYASAFAMCEFNVPKVLFVVHREQILRKSLQSYKKVFGASRTMGLLTGNSKDENKQYMFATVQTLSKSENLKNYSPTAFDLIVIDEGHHAPTPMYKKIMDYFKPKMWLGMTGSPDRADKKNVYEVFDNNIAYEIRLQHALEEGLLCPFHYFGITDIAIDGKLPSDDQYNFNQLHIEQRVQHMLEKARKYGYSGSRVKGLVFCRSLGEAEELSNEFNRQGLKTTFLTGDNSPEEREAAIEKLVSDNPSEEHYDYIFTKDIFSEGIDIPAVNQVLMVRPTKSPVVFIQQLGRGLRKHPGKDFVVILDFIGNYKENYMIPVALSGDNSYNKDNLRRYVSTGTQIIPGISTVYFDEVARKEIYRAIDQAKTHLKTFIVSKYRELKNKLGRIPSIRDFEKFGSIDVQNIFNEYGSYHEFLLKVERQTYKTVYNEKQREILKFISKRLVPGKRPHELELLKQAIEVCTGLFQSTENALLNRYGLSLNPNDMRSAFSYLTNQFENPASRKALKDCVFLQSSEDNDWQISDSFSTSLKDSSFKNEVQDLITLGIENYTKRYKSRYKDTNFVLYEKYTAEDVCRLFNWKEKQVPLNMSGYYYDSETKTFPVFINYEKSEGEIQYDDRFISPSQLIALSKKQRQVNCPDANHIYKRTPEDNDNRIYLFVRKNKDDPARGTTQGSNEYYFLGEVHANGEPNPVHLRDGNDAFEIDYRLDIPVRSDIYEYLLESFNEEN